MEVDGWTGFSRHLEHAGGAEPRTPDLLVHCHASILAQACNFGLTRMAQLADLSYRQLAWCTTWYLREETLKPAIASIVNRHHRQSLAQLWGGGTENINALHAGDVGLRINPDPFQGDSE